MMPAVISLAPESVNAKNREPSRRATELIREAIEQGAQFLPSQGPITVFIHHNTLHAFDNLPFHVAVERASGIYGCQPYMAEHRYRDELARGRMFFSDVQQVLGETLGSDADEKIAPFCTRGELQLAMLQFPLRYGPTNELRWFVAETDTLRRVRDDVSAATKRRLIAETRRWVMRDLRSRVAAANELPRHSTLDPVARVVELLSRYGTARIENWSASTWEAFTLQSLWRVCCEGVASVPVPASHPQSGIRLRDALLATTGQDTDVWVNDMLVPFCSAYLDQGLARWQLPRRDEGFYTSFFNLYRLPGGPPDPWRRGLSRELVRIQKAGLGAIQSIHESLTMLGVPEEDWAEYLASTLIALRGWAGMIWFLEHRPDRAVHSVPPGSLVEYVAIRLILDRLAVSWLAKEHLGYCGPLPALRDNLDKQSCEEEPTSVEQRSFAVFQLAQVLCWSPLALSRLDEADWRVLVQEIESFTVRDRLRVFHSAYERRFQTQVLDALALHASHAQPATAPPLFQVTFCIDEREESIRRHLEELVPNAMTYGIAGFYFLDMYYRGATDAHFVPLCPPVMVPKHWVVECADDGHQDAHRWAANARRALGLASHQFHVGSRTLTLSTLISTVGGLLATVPLIARTLFPRLTAQVRRSFGQAIFAPPATRLQLERKDLDAHVPPPPIGFTIDEMAVIAERVLRDLGLTSQFSRLVIMLGHGSTSMNNPHKSAYDCGACGGSQGGPSSRAIAWILNHPAVRQQLSQRGISIPAETIFVGGMHNTSNDTVTYEDLDLVPESHRALLDEVRARLDAAADRDALERCRRFHSAPLSLSLEEAREHVEGRAEDLSQVRPELGHATNAIAVVGRRARTRGLFLDRRAFLNSYDPTQDDAAGTILERILQAMVPVCAGINLEYYFSYVDNSGYGSGTKLPHNVTALLGVMDGAASDLRTGLPWQMVEIHEPVRLLLIVETTPETIRGILDRNPSIEVLVRNEWIWLAILDPDSATLRTYRAGDFLEYHPSVDQLPWAPTSADWYRGWRGHLEFARIGNPPTQGYGSTGAIE